MATQWTTSGNDSLGYADGNVKIDCDNDSLETGTSIAFSTDGESTELMRIQDNGNVGIGTTNPGETLQVNGNIRVDDGSGVPGANRVWATEKVFNVLDYGAVPVEAREDAFGSTASIDAATDQITQSNPAGAFANAQVGDTLWVFNGANFGDYTITQLINNNTVQVSAFISTHSTNDVRWKVTSGTPADCTGGFHDAIEAANAAGGGTVIVPAGYFFFTGSITVLGNVTLQGMCKGPHIWSKQAWERHSGQGSVLLSTANDGSPTAEAFITMDDTDRAINAAIDGLSVFYPNQRITSGSTTTTPAVVMYPYCIEIGTLNINDIRISNMLLVNPYQGIRTPAETTQRFGRITISNIRGCPLLVGIWLDGLFDVSYIEDILFSPVNLYDFDGGGAGTSIEDKDWNTFVANNLTAIHVLHAEFAIIRNVFAWIANRGLLIDSSTNGGAVFMGENIQFDCVNVGIEVMAGSVHLTNIKIQASQPLAAIVNNSFSYGDMFGILADSIASSADLHIIGGSIGAAGTQCVRWDGQGIIDLFNIDFVNSRTGSAMTDGILVNVGRVNVIGCRFFRGSNGYTNCINITNTAVQGTIYGNDFLDNLANTIGINNAANDGFNILGSVGIGTTSPAQTLDVVGNAILRGEDGWDGAGDEARLNLGDTNQQVKAIHGTGLIFKTDTADNNSFFWRNSSDTNLMCLLSNGNLGIGTTPAYPLHLKSSNTYDHFVIENGETNKKWSLTSVKGSALGVSDFFSISDVGGTSRISVDSAGDVGMGTYDPATKLDVRGNITATGPQWSTSGDTAFLYLGVGNFHYIKAKYGTGVQIGTYGADEAITLQESSGNVGIGTTNPSEKLHVDGMLRLKVYTDATRGSAGTAGRVIYNSTDGNLNIDNGTNWILPNGSVT